MNIWKTCRLGEVVELSQGLAINSKTKHLLVPESKLPLLKIRDLINNTQEDFVDEEKVSGKCIAKSDDLIFTRTGQVGLIFTGKTGVIHNNCFKVIPGEELDRLYLYWFLKQKEIVELANSIASGSVQKDLNHSAFKSIEISFPDLPTQQKIAEILSALDDKIELNRRMNQTLEQMAETLFRQYFVDGIDADNLPEGWREGSIYEIADVVYGAAFSSKLFNENKEGLPLIRIRDLKNFQPQFYTTEKHTKATVIKKGDIIVGMDAEFNPCIWRGENAYLNQRVCFFKPKFEEVHNYFIYETIKPHLKFFESAKVGTTVIHLGKSDIDTFSIIIPTVQKLKEYKDLVSPLFDKIISLSSEIKTLTNLRDTLLPKLMSGEIDVMQTQPAGAYEEVLS